MYAIKVIIIILQRAVSAESYNNKQQSSKKKHYADKKEIDLSIVGEPTAKQPNYSKSINNQQ